MAHPLNNKIRLLANKSSVKQLKNKEDNDNNYNKVYMLKQADTRKPHLLLLILPPSY